MALLFMDGFDAADYSIKWDNWSGTATSTTSTRFSTGRAVNLGGSEFLYKNFTASAQITCGFAVTGTSWEIDTYGDIGSTNHLAIVRNSSTGFIELRRGGGSGTILATGTTFITSAQWTYIEFQSTVADAGGIGIVRINGNTTPDINFTGDTKNGGTNTTIDAIRLNTGTYDDLYILNSTGTSNTSFLGDVRVRTLTPNADGASSQLSGSDGDSLNNWQNIDELPYSTTDYNGSTTAGNRDTYNISDVPSGVSVIYALQNNTIAGKSDAKLGSAKPLLRIGGTNYYGTTQISGSSYINYKDIYNSNPATTVAWTVADVASMEIGMEVG